MFRGAVRDDDIDTEDRAGMRARRLAQDTQTDLGGDRSWKSDRHERCLENSNALLEVGRIFQRAVEW